MTRVITFTNLFPSMLQPHHGRFVQDRMRRVISATGFDWIVVDPVPRVPWIVRQGRYRALSKMPSEEVYEGARIRHVFYPHLPGASLGAQARRVAKACLPVVRELAQGGGAILDAHYVYPDGVAALQIAAELDLPCVVTARGTDLNLLPERPVVRKQIQEWAPRADALLAVSDSLRRRFVEVAGVPDDAVALARNGVDLEFFRPGNQTAARVALGLPVDRPLVLGVGSLIRRKGYDLAVAAMQELPDDVALVLVGDGDQRADLQRALPEDRLFLLGSRHRYEVALAYQAADVFVHPAHREGWPNVVTEALACGLPVVAHSIWGIPEILQDDGVSQLVDENDVPGLAAGLRRFLEHPVSREIVRGLAELYSWDATVLQLVELFEELRGRVRQ